MATTIFKTGSVLSTSSIGVGKFVFNIPGGAPALATSGTGISVTRKGETGDFMTFRAKVYNGYFTLTGSTTPIEDAAPVSVTAENYVDEDGNNIKFYTIRSGISSGSAFLLRWSAGTTRVEIWDADNFNRVGLWGDDESTIIRGVECNVEQLAYLPYNSLLASYVEDAYGDLKVFKNRNDITAIQIQGSHVTGDINNLTNSAYNLTSIGGYNSQIYGELKPLLEAMKAAGVKNRTLAVSASNTGVTYEGKPFTSVTTFTFDANGNYTHN